MLQKSHLVLIAVADGSVRTLKNWYKSAIPRKALFSPDGSHIVFDFEQQDNPGCYDIFLVERDSESEIPLIQHPADDRLFGWSPDGQTIIFTSDRTAGRGLWTIDILDGVSQGPAELLIDEFNGSGLGFASDGSCYYVVDTKASNVCLARLDSTVTIFEDHPQLASSKFVGHTALGDFAHDGSFLAYRAGVRHRISTGDCLFVINALDTGQERVLRPKPAFRPNTRIWDGPWFYPDGNSLLVLGTGLETGYGLYKVEIETGVVTPIHVPCGKDVRSAALSPDAGSIYLRTIYRISKLDVSTGRETMLYKQQQWGPWSLDISPDGQWLAFYPSPDSLAIIPAEGGEPIEVINGSDGEIRSPLAFVKWTPDGKYILFGKRKNELWKVNVETGEQHQIAVIDMELMDAAIHPDGQYIALTTYEAGSQLWVMENFLPQRRSE
jgi:Tol biopolymer transport system component